MTAQAIALPQLKAEYGTLRQVAYVVEDLDEAMEYWRDTHNVNAFAVARNAKPLSNATYRGQKSETVVIDVAFGYLGDLQLELIELKQSVPSMYKEVLDRSQKDLQHYGVTVEDFQTTYEALSNLGFESIVDCGVKGLAQMSYVEATDFNQSIFAPGDERYMKTPEGYGIVLELIEWNPLTRPYFDAIEKLVNQVPKGQLYQEFNLDSLTPIGEVFKRLPGFLWKKLTGRL